MEFWHQLLHFALFLPLISCEDPMYHHCDQNFTNNNSLQDNINKSIFTLIAKTPSAGHAITTVGTDANTVYGLTQCRGDISPQNCSDCITAAAKELRGSCPDSAALRAGSDICKLRLDIADFHGKMDFIDVLGGGLREDAEIPRVFDDAKWHLLNWVKLGAVSANNSYAMGKKVLIVENTTIYGMAQCTTDLQSLTCMKCLETLANKMRGFCTLRKRCFEMASSCDLRYDTDNFFSDAADVPLYPENGETYALSPLPLA